MFHICLCCLVRHGPFPSFLHSCLSSGPSPPLHMRTRHLCGSSFLRQSHLRRETSRIASIPFPLPLFSFVFDSGSRNVSISGIKELFLRDPFVHTKRSLPIGFVPCRRSWQEIPKHGLEFLPESPSCGKTRLLASHELDNDPKGRATFVSRNTIVVHTSSGSHHPSTRTHHVCAVVISSVILARHLVTMSTFICPNTKSWSSVKIQAPAAAAMAVLIFSGDRHVSCVVVQNLRS